MSKRSVLLTCAGQRVDVVRAFREALDGLGWDGDVVAVDANPLSPALMKADRGVVVPLASSPDYVPALADLVAAHGVRAVLPLADLDNVELVAGRALLERAGAALLLPDLAVAEAMFDKYRCHEALLAAGLPSPDTWIPEELPARPPLPLLVKRRWGYASRDIYRCETLAEVRFFVDYAGVPVIVQRFCPGEQFSIDVLCDLEGRAVNVIPRTMIESKGGESIKGQTIADPRLIDLGRRGRRGPAAGRPGHHPVLRRARGAAGDRHQLPLRRRLPAAARGRARATPSWCCGSPAASASSRTSAAFTARRDDDPLLRHGDPAARAPAAGGAPSARRRARPAATRTRPATAARRAAGGPRAAGSRSARAPRAPAGPTRRRSAWPAPCADMQARRGGGCSKKPAMSPARRPIRTTNAPTGPERELSLACTTMRTILPRLSGPPARGRSGETAAPPRPPAPPG